MYAVDQVNVIKREQKLQLNEIEMGLKCIALCTY